MTDFKLTLYNLHPDVDPRALAQGVLDEYGDDFDAARGDFAVDSVESGDVEIVMRDVAKGDARLLREDIYRDFGDADDRMMIRASSGDAARGSWFATDLDDDDE